MNKDVLTTILICIFILATIFFCVYCAISIKEEVKFWKKEQEYFKNLNKWDKCTENNIGGQKMTKEQSEKIQKWIGEYFKTSIAGSECELWGNGLLKVIENADEIKKVLKNE